MKSIFSQLIYLLIYFPCYKNLIFSIVKGIIISSLLEVLLDSKFVIFDAAFMMKGTEAACFFLIP